MLNRCAAALLLVSAAALPAADDEPKYLPSDTKPRTKFGAFDYHFDYPEPVTRGGAGVIWEFQGPAPMFFGQNEGMDAYGGPVCGAIAAVCPHPTDADKLMVGAVNGGIWRTANATSTTPAWEPLADEFRSLSISDLTIDPTDGTAQSYVACVGRYSSFGRRGGPRGGVLVTNDGGDSWQLRGLGTLSGKNLSGAQMRGNTIVVSVNNADDFTYANIGIWRSTDAGATFTQVNTGIPVGVSYSIGADPSNPNRLFTSVLFADSGEANNGIYRSDDFGATWTRVSDATINALMASGSVTSNVEIAVGTANNVFAGVINSGRLAGLYRSGNGGTSWTSLDLPSTNENGTPFGIQPSPKPGAQGAIHFSIAADPIDHDIVYVGGDRQPGGSETGGFPNSIGANDYSGRLFRVDAGLAPGSQAIALTHQPSTTLNSSPHADSRDMAFDAQGHLIEGDDGGLYRRTNPSGTGDWIPAIGSLNAAEFHSVEYDAVLNRISAGAQDNGTSIQSAAGSTEWTQIFGGDGGVVGVDDHSQAGSSISTHYISFQFFQAFSAIEVDQDFNILTFVQPGLDANGAGYLLSVDSTVQFYTPFEINRVQGGRGTVGTQFVYETTDNFETLTTVQALGTGDRVVAMAAGGMKNGVPAPEALWAASFGDVYFRRPGQGMAITPFPGSATIRDLAASMEDYEKAVVAESTNVFVTADGGANWTNVTGSLAAETTLTSGTPLRTCAYIDGPSYDLVLVGSHLGVHMMKTTEPGVWTKVGTELPNAVAYDLRYDIADDVLVVGTLGRGAWIVNNASLKLMGTGVDNWFLL